MKASESLIGCTAVSLAGRDKGRMLIIIGICDENSVFVSDGRLRKVATPKKKKMRHLKVVSKNDAESMERIAAGLATDSFVRKLLDSTSVDDDDLI